MEKHTNLLEFIQKEVEKIHRITILESELKEIDEELKVLNEEKKGGDWPKKLKKGRFGSYCKKQGFDGANISCAEKAMDSDDSSVRGMAAFYMNTVQPKGKKLSDIKDECKRLEEQLNKKMKK